MQPESSQIQSQQQPPTSALIHNRNGEQTFAEVLGHSDYIQRAIALTLSGKMVGRVAFLLRKDFPELTYTSSYRLARLPIVQRARSIASPEAAKAYTRALAERNSSLLMLRQIDIGAYGSERNATPAANVVFKVAGLLQEQPAVQLNAETIQVLQMLRDAPSRGASRSKSEEDGVKSVDGERVKE